MADAARYWEDVKEGDALPEVRVAKLTRTDFVKYAESYGAPGHRPSSAGDLERIVERAFETKGVHLVDVPVDYSENDLILNREIRELSAAI